MEYYLTQNEDGIVIIDCLVSQERDFSYYTNGVESFKSKLNQLYLDKKITDFEEADKIFRNMIQNNIYCHSLRGWVIKYSSV